MSPIETCFLYQYRLVQGLCYWQYWQFIDYDYCFTASSSPRPSTCPNQKPWMTAEVSGRPHHRGTLNTDTSLQKLNSISAFCGGCREVTCHPQSWPPPTEGQSRASSEVSSQHGRRLHRFWPSVMDIYNMGCLGKAKSIVDDPTHPSHVLFSLLPSGRRFRSLRTNTDKVT